jgi:hypothetical protein
MKKQSKKKYKSHFKIVVNSILSFLAWIIIQIVEILIFSFYPLLWVLTDVLGSKSKKEKTRSSHGIPREDSQGTKGVKEGE